MTTITDAMVEAAWEAFERVFDESHKDGNSQNVDVIRAALEAAERAAWRPIEEAPKDGTSVLLGGGEWLCEERLEWIGTAAVAYWNTKCWAITGSDARDVLIAYEDPTHFRPVPTPHEENNK